MSNYGLSNIPSGGYPSNYPIGGGSLICGMIDSITRLLYSGKWIEAQEKMQIAMLRAKADERKQILNSLKEIALRTEDDQMRFRMFQQIQQYLP